MNRVPEFDVTVTWHRIPEPDRHLIRTFRIPAPTEAAAGHAGYGIAVSVASSLNPDPAEVPWRILGFPTVVPVDPGTEPWRTHEPLWAPFLDAEFTEQRALAGCDCGQCPAAGEYGPFWFSAHLRDLEAPNYMIDYWRHWAATIEAPTGRIDRDQVARELSDYITVSDNASEVFSELAGLSKPNTDPGWVISGAEEKYAALYAEFLCDRITSLMRESNPPAVLVDYLLGVVQEWRPGAWEEHVKHQPRPVETVNLPHD